ncbi:MAG TPA: 3-hydroxyacyl-CoA dehydrogenase NAD-binding domain-containing protein [Cyclobacteriaceae bacterium]|jgi:3-hydroxybutyryl-CoA dehydrogenase|nr:3-hydroxyacyl-CoA dehydrogenase NAD-binding domain-containing protein [Cyclobacteriaceae bacterium]
MRPINKIGVIGAGSMGQGIAQVCASSGYEVLLHDADVSSMERAIQNIGKNFDQAIAKGKSTEEKKREVLLRIKLCSFEMLKVDLVAEAVIEKLEVKQKLFSELEKINDPDTIFTTNTSSLSVSKIGSNLNHPERLLGLHFFNPAYLMKLVEVVSGEKTDSDLVKSMAAFVKAIEKTPVVVKDSPGFIVNRVARHYYLESLHLLQDDAADIGTIDALLRSAGFKLGPFELMDLIGNDVNLEVSRLMYDAFNKVQRFKPNRIQEEKVSSGQLGRKTGKGYYNYEKK